MTDSLPFHYPDEAPAAQTGAAGKRCRRHVWAPRCGWGRMHALVNEDPELAPVCIRCGAERSPAATRRGRNNRARGNAIEREIAAKLGLRRVGQYGGPEDATGEWLVVQVKSGGSFPERAWRWLQALPANAGQTRAVVLTDAPGPGHRRRAVVIVELDDWAALHGDGAG